MNLILDHHRVSGGMLGLLVGDALGVPYEFKSPQDIPDLGKIEMLPPKNFNRSHAGVPPGTWSDDGAQALCLARTIIDAQSLDLRLFANRLLQWVNDGYYAIDCIVFDCGSGTRFALDRLESGVDPKLSGGDGINSNGNGSLMRVLPLVLWHRGSCDELISLAQAQSLPTHRHPISQVCCAYYCLVARSLLQGATDLSSITDSVDSYLLEHYQGNSVFLSALKGVIESPFRGEPKGSGFVVDSLWSALWALDQGNYETVVRKAISLGRDTDTTACIAGGLAGIRDGACGIPQRWLNVLRGSEWCDPIINELCGRAVMHPFMNMDVLPDLRKQTASKLESKRNALERILLKIKHKFF